jgi:hypothetical protein
MKKIIGIASAAALLLVAGAPAFGQQQVAFKLLGGLAWMQGDDYNTGILGAYRLAKDTSDSLTGGYGQLSGGWILQAEIVNYWGSHIGVGIGGGFYRMSGASGVAGVASVPDPTYQFTSVYTPKISVIPLFINLHYKFRMTERVGADVFAGPVFQVAQYGFRRQATSSLNSLSELETFNASDTALGLQGGLTLSIRIVRGITLIAEGFYRAGRVSDIKGNWFLNSTTSSGTVTTSSNAYYVWAYDLTSGGTLYPRIGYFDANGPTGPGVSNPRKAGLNLSGPAVLIGFKFGI